MIPNPIKYLPLIFFLSLSMAYADDVTISKPEPPAADTDLTSQNPPPADQSTISKPEAVPAESDQTSQAPASQQKPSQGEGEKAPVQSRPTAVPEFSLPEVVITGENELTIGAKRLDRKENEVTMGSHDLSGVDRAVNDLPGLSKTFTALTAEEPGPSKDTALILRLGGGTPNTYGGWGLFGQEFKDVQYLLSGFYSTWGGQATLAGFDGDRKYNYGFETKLFPAEPLSFHLAANVSQTDAELPYQNSIRELHQGLDLNGSALWKLSDLVQAQFKVSNQTTTLNYWDQGGKNNQTQELEAQIKLNGEDIDPLLNRFSLEAGGRHATSDFSGSAVPGYDWGWFGLQVAFKEGENLSLTAKVQGQGGDGLNLPLQFYPGLDLMWRFFGRSQLNLYWRTDRYVDNFHNTFMDTEHLSPEAGFPSPTEVTGEWGGRFTQKLSEKIILSLSGSVAQIQNYHQWTDISLSVPSYIQSYSTLAQVQLDKAGANVQWNFMKDWQAAATYQWTQGVNNPAAPGNLTDLPLHKGVLSLYRGDDKLETRLELQVASNRQAFQTVSLDLPAYFTVGLDATYHLSKTFSLWANGDNLLGESYQIQYGYLEPQFHVRGGVEVIF